MEKTEGNEVTLLIERNGEKKEIKLTDSDKKASNLEKKDKGKEPLRGIG